MRNFLGDRSQTKKCISDAVISFALNKLVQPDETVSLLGKEYIKLGKKDKVYLVCPESD